MMSHSTIAPCSIQTSFLSSIASESAILNEIYNPKHNIAIWQRALPSTLTADIDKMLAAGESIALVKSVSPEETAEYIRYKLSDYDCAAALSEDIALIVDMFCCLFNVKAAGMRLTALDTAMCPKFHVDQIPCRLVTTFSGLATQWLESQPSEGADTAHTSANTIAGLSELNDTEFTVQQMQAGDVALLKGSGWEGNENRGLIHRSPALETNERRLLLTLDLL
ncbi:DUF1826 domain-containing protein [Psychromonas aquatilis]|uniref:DUF1826 domain-containing protein n=1 Tax=Psychromonas aquatilis TaxID=2005072 RepID=A0ABU9GTE2_9GAMM